MADALPIVKGTLDVLVLRTLSWGAMHGFEITCWLEEHSAGALELTHPDPGWALVARLPHP